MASVAMTCKCMAPLRLKLRASGDKALANLGVRKLNDSYRSPLTLKSWTLLEAEAALDFLFLLCCICY